MVTVSQIVKKIVKEQPFVEEALGQRILSFGNFAEQILPRVEQELEKKVRHSAIIMALRRYADEIDAHNSAKKFNFRGEIIIKSNICDFTVAKSSALLSNLRHIHSLVDYERGDNLNIILGNNEVSIIISDRHLAKLEKFLSREKILNKEKNLIAFTVIFTSDDFMHTPGIIFQIVRKLAWENINIYEVVSTMTELTFILNKKDSIKAYNILYELVSK